MLIFQIEAIQTKRLQKIKGVCSELKKKDRSFLEGNVNLQTILVDDKNKFLYCYLAKVSHEVRVQSSGDAGKVAYIDIHF